MRRATPYKFLRFVLKHNGKFADAFLRRYGIRVRLTDCICVRQRSS